MSDDLTIPNPSYRTSRAGRYGSGLRVQQTMDPDTRRLMLFALALGAILSILIAISAVTGHRRTDIPVITADPRPIRIKPDNPGGMKINGADNDLFSGEADNRTARLAATAETPDTVALTATGTRSGAHTSVGTPAPTVEPPPAPQIPTQTIYTQTVPTQPEPAPPKAAALIAPPSPAKPAIAKPAATATPKLPASAPPKPAAPAVAKPPVSAPEIHAAVTHQAVVQLAALASEEAAHDEWQQLTRRMPDVLSGHQPSYSRIEKDGHTFWRLRTAGFADVAGARGFCDHVRAKGGECSVADF